MRRPRPITLWTGPPHKEEIYMGLIYKNGISYGGGGGSAGGAVDSVNGKTGDVVLKTKDLENNSGYITASALPIVPTDVSAFNNDADYISDDLTSNIGIETYDQGSDSYIEGLYNSLLSAIRAIAAQLNTDTERAFDNWKELSRIALEVQNKLNKTLSTPIVIDGHSCTTVLDAITALNNYKINTSKIGNANGIAELDANGKVPQSQLPSYVDDVIDGYYNETDHKFYLDPNYTIEITGENGKIYLAVDTDLQYRWTGSAFSCLGGALTLGETSSTAYRGDRGKTAYDDSQTNKTAIGTLANLSTTNKSDLVSAINELDSTKAEAYTAGDGIDINNDEISVDPMPSADMSEIITPLPGAQARRMTYSTDEQVVGTWIDSKPVYQKTITGLSVALEDRSIVNAVDVTGMNVAKILMCTLYNDTRVFSAIGSLSGNTLQVYAPLCGGNTVNALTFQYTKTTD